MTTRNMQHITIKTSKGDRQVDAYVFGDWATHRAYVGDAPTVDDVPPHLLAAFVAAGFLEHDVPEAMRHWWVLTHVPTGLCVPPRDLGPLSEQEGILAAQHISNRMGGQRPFADSESQHTLYALVAESMDEEGL